MHPCRIAPCFPEGLKRAQSTQVGTHDTETPRASGNAVPIHHDIWWFAPFASTRYRGLHPREFGKPYESPYRKRRSTARGRAVLTTQTVDLTQPSKTDESRIGR